MDLGLSGKKAIVTGATRGIGRRVAELLAEEGCYIAFCARGEEGLRETEAAIRGRGVKAFGGTCNLRDGESYKAWLGRAVEQLGGADILVANVSAGRSNDGEPDWKRGFDIDLMGTVRAVEAVLPVMKQAGGGSILFMDSIGATETYVGPLPQNAFKAALLTYAKQLGQAHFRNGIRVNCVSPGPVAHASSTWEMTQFSSPRTHKAMLSQQPSRRFGTPDEIAKCAVFLASPAAGWVVGTNLVADGGASKRVQF
jgi:NAD(P)-dependent dehydrogenase (short-subunit alcohol dehydrogenase family)